MVVVLAAAGIALFRLTGGRWMSVETPSMARVAPVGTLVLSRPTTLADTSVGDLLVFTAPGAGSGMYLHRVVGIDADGGLHTRGDLNGAPDPWTVRDGDLVGRVLTLVPAGGWILQLLPLLLVGGLTLAYLARTYVPVTYRAPVVAVGLSLIAALALWVVHPLVRVVTITQTIDAGTFTTYLVPTGLMTLDVSLPRGDEAVLAPGELGRLTSSSPDPDGGFTVQLTPHLSPLWVALLLTVSLIPSVVCICWASRGGRATST